MVINPSTDPASVGMSLDRVQFEFKEHHCIQPDVPLIAGTDESGYGDDILNAFIPEDAEFSDVGVGLSDNNRVSHLYSCIAGWRRGSTWRLANALLHVSP